MGKAEIVGRSTDDTLGVGERGTRTEKEGIWVARCLVGEAGVVVMTLSKCIFLFFDLKLSANQSYLLIDFVGGFHSTRPCVVITVTKAPSPFIGNMNWHALTQLRLSLPRPKLHSYGPTSFLSI